MSHDFLKDKKVLVMGLGLHGGGVATVKWFAKYGAKVTATDLRDRITLRPSIEALEGVKVRYVLGKHDEKDFVHNDLIIANPGVPRTSPYLAAARAAGKKILNDAMVFMVHDTHDTIAVTGTRGKTTTTEWIAALLSKKYPEARASGNTPQNALLKEMERIKDIPNVPAVVELSSWQLELVANANRAPKVAVITSIFPDHLNRYDGIEDYALAKSNIFAKQTKNDSLVLNGDDKKWMNFFLKLKPVSSVFFFTVGELPQKKNGIFIRDGYAVIHDGEKEKKLMRVNRFALSRGEHNLRNLLAALLAVYLYDKNVKITEKDINALAAPRMRQEEVFKDKKYSIINDSCATSPDGVIAALRRFSGKGNNCILITGGTNKELEFDDLAKELKRSVTPGNLILLGGSATTKLIEALGRKKYSKTLLATHETLDECVRAAVKIAEGYRKVTILFSPGAASFEKFLHEFDRGQKFNAVIKGVFVREK